MVFLPRLYTIVNKFASSFRVQLALKAACAIADWVFYAANILDPLLKPVPMWTAEFKWKHWTWQAFSPHAWGRWAEHSWNCLRFALKWLDARNTQRVSKSTYEGASCALKFACICKRSTRFRASRSKVKHRRRQADFPHYASTETLETCARQKPWICMWIDIVIAVVGNVVKPMEARADSVQTIHFLQFLNGLSLLYTPNNLNWWRQMVLINKTSHL